MRAPSFKLIRRQLYTLLRSLSLSSTLSTKTHNAAQLANVTDEAFQAERWTDALIALDAMEELGHKPKLGSIQRWIAKSGDTWGTPMGTALIDAIIRSTGTMTFSLEGTPLEEANGLTRIEPWSDWEPSPCPDPDQVNAEAANSDENPTGQTCKLTDRPATLYPTFRSRFG
eukprot:8243111-Pyramimonas_sp.AAC.1